MPFGDPWDSWSWAGAKTAGFTTSSGPIQLRPCDLWRCIRICGFEVGKLMKFTAGKHVETSSILYCTEFSSKPCLIKRGRLKMSWNFPRLKRMIQIDENNFWVAQPPTSDCFFLREEERMCHMAGKKSVFFGGWKLYVSWGTR